ncbi:hypothetical protein ACIPO9_17340 [Pseudomonas sp. NPDC090203]|uniref:hypothetical protein n=1 Tax=Pseudomonas sp. NPDC090203 TaxID=3364477 RepID=UPI00381A62EA
MSKNSKKTGQTPSASLIAKMRNRGSVRSALWHVYSYKIDGELIFESHRELAHWLLYVEFDPRIIVFWKPTGQEFNSDQLGGRKVMLDIVARNSDGLFEWHEVKPGYIDNIDAHEQLKVQSSLAKASGAVYRVFDESTRDAHLYKVMPLLRLMTFVGVTRQEKRIPAIMSQVLQRVSHDTAGTIGSLSLALPHLSTTELVAGLTRLAIDGRVELVVEKTSPTLHTEWMVRSLLS